MHNFNNYRDLNYQFEGKRVAELARVSTDEQALKGLSIKAQVEALDEFVEDKKMILVDRYVDDGYSGGSLNRPALKRLIEDVKQGLIDVVIFTKLDRFSRKTAHYFYLKSIFDKYNVQWKTIHEDYDTTTANGQFQITIMIALAELERERARERVNETIIYKFKHKEPLNNSPMPGLKIEDKKYVIDEEKIDFVKFIFDKFEEIQSMYGLIKYLSDNHNITMEQRSLKRMLSHPIYIGEYHHPKLGIGKEYAPQIISNEQFERVQRLLKINIKRYKREQSRERVLKGLVECGCCGRQLTYTVQKRKKGEFVKYYCRYRYTRAKDCTVSASPYEMKIEEYILNNIFKEVDKLSYTLKDNVDKKIPKVDKTKLKRKLENVKFLFEEGEMSIAEYQSKTKAIKDQLEEPEVVQQISQLEEIKKQIPTNFKEVYESLNVLERRRLLSSFIQKIRVHSGNRFEIKFF